MISRTISAESLKRRCRAILNEVEQSRCQVVITKHGRPVARLLPAISDRARENEVLACLRGRGRMLVSEREFLKPLTREAGWRLGTDE